MFFSVLPSFGVLLDEGAEEAVETALRGMLATILLALGVDRAARVALEAASLG